MISGNFYNTKIIKLKGGKQMIKKSISHKDNKFLEGILLLQKSSPNAVKDITSLILQLLEIQDDIKGGNFNEK